jgi:hypothetical protein
MEMRGAKPSGLNPPPYQLIKLTFCNVWSRCGGHVWAKQGFASAEGLGFSCL